MDQSTKDKVTAAHLSRNAYLYVRQSTLRQVHENQESTRRQYDLRERAIALGWQAEQVVVIDCDLGQSGASTAGRKGFRDLVSEVGMGNAGIVLGLEVSRLARNSSDWHRLLEISALSDTLLLDEDGLYNPTSFNDRLLLGLKGTMSEAELHLLKARLQGGLLAKARRGELAVLLPVGFVYDDADPILLDPDVQVQQSVRLFFDTFKRLGSACGVTKYFNDNGILFPTRARTVRTCRDVHWTHLSLPRAAGILHNPRYAGAFVYGRRRNRKRADGKFSVKVLPREQWQVLLPDTHVGYITWDQFERNVEQLRKTARAFNIEKRRVTPREGPALLQGLALCGVCGRRMTVRYHSRKSGIVPAYFCVMGTMQFRQPPCQLINGTYLDVAFSQLLLDTVTPMALQMTLAVQAQVQARHDEVDRLRQMQVTRVEEAVDRARRRYMQVDPSNRLVAASLEADWNEQLRALDDARAELERQRKEDPLTLDKATRERILDLSRNFATVWNDPATPAKERKRLAALLVEDVTLMRDDGGVTAQVRFRGGATTTLRAAVPIRVCVGRKTPPDVVAAIDALADIHNLHEVAAILNERGMRTGAGDEFTPNSVHWVMFNHGLRLRRSRRLDNGRLGMKTFAEMLGIGQARLREWARKGWVRVAFQDTLGRVFEPLTEQPERIRQLVAAQANLGTDGGDDAIRARGAV